MGKDVDLDQTEPVPVVPVPPIEPPEDAEVVTPLSSGATPEQ
jgi:hypothetical protein